MEGSSVYKPTPFIPEQKLTARRVRADAERNRERLVAAAKEVLSAGGAEASLEAVARQAGVGIATLYRHFPTREALFEAVYRREVDQLVELATALAALPGPAEALRHWLHAAVGFVATKKGLGLALALAAQATGELKAYTSERLTAAVGGLLDRAVATGDLRSDIGPGDVLRMLVALCYESDAPGWQGNVLRLLDVFVDGLLRPPGAP